MSRRAKIALALGVLVVVAIAAAMCIKAMVSHRASQTHAGSYSAQVTLPFTRLDMPTGIAMDAAGNSYVTEYIASQVWKLAAGANGQPAAVQRHQEPDGRGGGHRSVG